MDRIVMNETDSLPVSRSTPATYAERRAAMADETRTRILDACVAILGRGVAELSIPAVAREAGVSVPTVYRNFPDKKTLVQETALYLKSLRGNVTPPDHLDDLPMHLRKMFGSSSGLTETVRAALASEPILAAKRELGADAERRAQMATLLGSALDGLAPQDREVAVLVATVLCSSATLRAFHEIAGVDANTTADAVAWTIARILGRPWQTTTLSTLDAPPATAKRESTTPRTATKARRPSKKGSSR
jgi:AcrR family transcriptional regulator